MRARFQYDVQRDPPAPALPIAIGPPGGEPTLVLGALVDTGADITVIPRDTAARLRLPIIAHVRIGGVGGFTRQASIHAAVVEAASFRRNMNVIALGNEVLVGRDLLNQWNVILRGPERVLEVETETAMTR